MATKIEDVKASSGITPVIVEELKKVAASIASEKAAAGWDYFETLGRMLSGLPNLVEGMQHHYTFGEVFDAYMQAERTKAYYFHVSGRSEAALDDFVGRMRGAILSYITDIDSASIVSNLYLHLNECGNRLQSAFTVFDDYSLSKSGAFRGKSGVVSAISSSVDLYIFAIIKSLIIKQHNKKK